jgi:hypothetical protein
VPPREFANIQEMESCIRVIDRLSENVKEYVLLLKTKSEKLSEGRQKMTQEEYGKAIEALNNEITELELRTGKEVKTCTFEDSDFNAYFQFFEKWGKNWFGTIQEYVEFRQSLNEANQQPKAKK